MDEAKKIAQGINKYLEGSKKTHLLPMVIRELQKQTKTEMTVVESAVELLASEKTEIEDMLGKKFTWVKEINYVINPKLLGGVRINIGGLELDLSVLGQFCQNYEN